MLEQLLDAVRRRMDRAGIALGDDLSALARRLGPEEPIDAHVRGRDEDETIVWAATSRRVLIVERELFERDVEAVWWRDAREVMVYPHGAVAMIALTTTRKVYHVDGVPLQDAEAFAAYAHARMRAADVPG